MFCTISEAKPELELTSALIGISFGASAQCVVVILDHPGYRTNTYWRAATICLDRYDQAEYLVGVFDQYRISLRHLQDSPYRHLLRIYYWYRVAEF